MNEPGRPPERRGAGGILRLRELRIEHFLPLACLASATVLFAAELMTMFEFRPPGGEPLAEQTAGERHGYALAVIAVFAVVATVVAVVAGSKPAAIGVGVAGGIALLVFLIVDLPDAGAVGTLEDARQSFFDAEAVPREGFWLGLVGAVGLAVSGIALATLSPEQLSALPPGGRAGNGEGDRGEMGGGAAGGLREAGGPSGTPSRNSDESEQRRTPRIGGAPRGRDERS